MANSRRVDWNKLENRMQTSSLLDAANTLLHHATWFEEAAQSEAVPSGYASRLTRCANALRVKALELCEEAIETDCLVEGV